MRRVVSIGSAMPALAMALVLGAAVPVRAGDAVTIAHAVLETPPDSHEPQKALVEVTNPDATRAGPVTVTCAFLSGGGTSLQSVDAAIADVPGHASAKVALIYYGYPRAQRLECRVAGGG